jgi:hypothetical protein
LESRAATEISIAERRAVQWPWGAPEQEGSHARRAAKDSNLVWGRILPQKLGALRRVPRQLPAERMQEVALQAASPSQLAAKSVLEAQRRLQQAGPPVLETLQLAQPPVLPEREAAQRPAPALPR